MQTLAERPLLLSVLIGMVAATLLYVWSSNGKRSIGIAGVLTGLLIPVVWMIASSIETDREQIEAIIHRTARAVQENNHQLAVSVIDDDEVRQRALADLPRYVFEHVSARNIKIREIEGSSPPQADVELTATAIVSTKRGTFKNIRVPRKVLLTFVKIADNQWLVSDYNHMQINGQIDAYSPSQRTTSRLNRGN